MNKINTKFMEKINFFLIFKIISSIIYSLNVFFEYVIGYHGTNKENKITDGNILI